MKLPERTSQKELQALQDKYTELKAQKMEGLEGVLQALLSAALLSSTHLHWHATVNVRPACQNAPVLQKISANRCPLDTQRTPSTALHSACCQLNAASGERRLWVPCACLALTVLLRTPPPAMCLQDQAARIEEHRSAAAAVAEHWKAEARRQEAAAAAARAPQTQVRPLRPAVPSCSLMILVVRQVRCH